MELLFIFLFLLGVGSYLAIGIAGVIAVGMLGLIAVAITIRFWYIPAIVLFVLCLLIFSFIGLLPWFLGIIVALIGIAFFVPTEKISVETEENLSFWLPRKYTIQLINLVSLVICTTFFRYIANIQDWLGIILASIIVTFILDVILYSKRPSLFA